MARFTSNVEILLYVQYCLTSLPLLLSVEMYRQRSPRYGDTPNIEEEPTEYTSLLPKPTDLDSSEDPGCYESHDSDDEGWRQYLTELWILFKGSIPVILAYTLQNSLQTVSVLIVGRSSPENLATTAFSLMFAMITAWMIALGGTTALDTLASSTFTGSSNKHDLGILLQRGFFVLSLFYIPVAILWACSEPVFLLLGQDPQLSRDSARFLTCLIPGGLGYIYFEVMKKYLQAQGKTRLIVPPLNPVTNFAIFQASCVQERMC